MRLPATAYSSSHNVVLVWDSDCSFCQRWVERFKKLDRFQRIHSVGSSEVDNAPPEWVQGWSPEILEKSMWVKDLQNGQSFTGFAAFRRLVKTLPMGRLLASLLAIPPVPQLGEKLYAWVARNRYRMGCKSGVCEISKGNQS